MPWTAHFVADGAYAAFAGHTGGAEILAAVSEFFAHGDDRKPRFALFDFTLVGRCDVQAKDVERVVIESLRAAKAAPDLVIALVTPRAVQYGLARMWQIRVEPTQWRTAVVTSLEEALRWLGEHGIDTDRLALPEG